MAQTISLKNFPNQNIIANTTLTAGIAAGVTSLPVENSSDYVAGPVLVGFPGSERAELVTATAPTTSIAIPTGTTKLPHNLSDPVYLVFGNQLKIYSATDTYGTGQQPDDSGFTLVATVTIDASKANTSYTHTAGTTSTWYKYTFYNSTTTAETTLADSRAAQAGAAHYVSLDDIRSSAGFDDAPQVTDDKIAKFRDAAEREIDGALSAIIILPLPQPTNPIIEQITKNIAAGELMQDEYNTISPTIAATGGTRAKQARKGGGNFTSLDDIIERLVVLQDANYTDLTRDDAPYFRGYPDATANTVSNSVDDSRSFTINEQY